MDKTEAKIQQEIVMWFRNSYCLKFHNPRCLIFSVPNEGEGKNAMMYKKSIGLMAGVADLIILLPSKVLFIEVKTEKGTQSTNQKDFEQAVTLLGFAYFIVRSLEEFQIKLKEEINFLNNE